MKKSILPDKGIYIFIGIAILLNFTGLFNTIMGPDAALYASISKNMAIKNDYINLYYAGKDWLDKPHFPFWITAFSFKLFGINTWAYKLPAILFLMMGAYYTYLFAKNLYNKNIALLAVLILLTAQHIVLSDNDVRAEPYLTGLIIASLYHFYKSYTLKNNLHLLAASVFTACAIMTKGMFALVPIGSAVLGELIIKKNWKELFQLRWLIALALIGIFILPELYCLYQQFDLHPEKTVFEKTNVSGIRFFFWDSQFGRFFNTGPIKGKGNPLFYFHTVLWSFLPWSILLIMAIATFIRKNFRKRYDHEWYCLSAALASFLFFSASQFQLPHYLNIIFPFFAIIVAQYLYGINTERTVNRISLIQNFIVGLLFLSPFLLQVIYEPGGTSWLLLSLSSVFIFFPLVLVRKTFKIQRVIYKTALASFFLNLYLNLVFYPSVMQYQAGSQAAFWINKNDQDMPVYSMVWSSPYIFYVDRGFHPTDTCLRNITDKKFLLFLPDVRAKRLIQMGKKIKILKEMDDYPITRMNMKFINSSHRHETLKKMDIAEVMQ
ncbi:MAG TPA: glycosyltransferase family 39 protein [Chitinophagaceae bacterium]